MQVHALRALERDDPGATPFERLVRRRHAGLWRFAAAILVDRARVDDVLQAAYIKTFGSGPPAFANEAHESAWLHKVVHRCALDELRRARRNRETPTAEVVPLGFAQDATQRTLADDAWRGLSDNDRAVLRLVDVVGFDYAEAARVLHIRRGTLASRLSVARDRLRRRMDSE